jgi:translation initiation factor IF-2
MMQAKEEEQQAAAADAVFPVILQIMENCIFNARDPIVLGCEVEEGIAKVPISLDESFVICTLHTSSIHTSHPLLQP